MIAVRCICCDSADLGRSPAILMPFVAKRALRWQSVDITPDWGLRDVQQGRAYPVCNSVLCMHCGALFLDIRFNAEEVASLYAGYRGAEYTAMREAFEPGYQARNDTLLNGVSYIPKVESFLNPLLSSSTRLKILDWGGGTGLNTPFRNGNIVSVFDISGTAPLPGVTALARPPSGPSGYDLIVFSNVLEHLPEPAAALLELTTVMSPWTILYIEVPYEDLMIATTGARNAHVFKKHWHEHINFFTPSSLEALIPRCNLSLIQMDSFDVFVAGKNARQLCLACRLPNATQRSYGAC